MPACCLKFATTDTNHRHSVFYGAGISLPTSANGTQRAPHVHGFALGFMDNFRQWYTRRTSRVRNYGPLPDEKPSIGVLTIPSPIAENQFSVHMGPSHVYGAGPRLFTKGYANKNWVPPSGPGGTSQTSDDPYCLLPNAYQTHKRN